MSEAGEFNVNFEQIIVCWQALGMSSFLCSFFLSQEKMRHNQFVKKTIAILE